MAADCIRLPGGAALRDLLAHASIRPAVLQAELNPFRAQHKLRFCREEGITMTGFSPLGASWYVSIGVATARESVLEQPAIVEAVRRHGKIPAQTALQWGVHRGTAVVPKTSHTDRLAEDLALFDFELSADEMQTIGALDRGRRFNDPGVFGEAAFHTFMPIYD
jgi:D-xylose reductase